MDTGDQLASACLLIRDIYYNSRYSSSWINSITSNYYYRTLLTLILTLCRSTFLTASHPELSEANIPHNRLRHQI